MLSHRNLMAMTVSHLADFDSPDENSSLLHGAPMSHGSGHNSLAFTMKACTQVIHQRWGFNPALFLEQVETHRVAALFMVPTQIKMIVEHPALDTRDVYGKALAEVFAAEDRLAATAVTDLKAGFLAVYACDGRMQGSALPPPGVRPRSILDR